MAHLMDCPSCGVPIAYDDFAAMGTGVKAQCTSCSKWWHITEDGEVAKAESSAPP